ncbi:dihydropteroate synthase [Halopenitus malekzadehii]|uniref:Probable bifunctional folylpolyglutamate synthase/dihydropteroate synthase n=1 Tax=Halopenitus malekzadehii TaxID=1267564 RepID=A0A1H6I348_9EURY|nr:dihydropteroate synthase [Halopenitus malekzadehii]SEH41004.1 dihydropteroate synthase [Halopenitus malekzadehii]
MHYHEAANFLFDLRRFSVRPGTDAVEALLDHLGNPETELEFVQIAGSNGKGSTARITESILRQTDRTVGLYTSPHLDDLSERIRVDGHPMSDDAIATFIERARPWLVDRAAAGEPLTFFEVVTAMGIWEFARRDVDVAVLEVGMGGEYDATSAVDPVTAAITNVSLEHTAVLGESVEEIARTKARIADEGTPVITACGGSALSVIREVVTDAGEDVRTVDGPTVSDPDPNPDVTATYHGRIETRSGRRSPTDSRIEVTGSGWSYDARLPLVGEYQATNAAIAVAIAHEAVARSDGGNASSASAPIPAESVRDGLATASWPGRFEVLGTDPLVVLDGAHNPAACRTLAGTLSEYEYDDLHLAFAAMHDKDHEGTIDALPTPESVHTCQPDHPRAADPDVLAAAFRNAGIEGTTVVPAVADALEAAIDRADADDCVLLTGSLFAVAEGRARYTRRVVPTQVDTPADAETLLTDADVGDPERDRVRDGLVHRVLRTRLDPSQAEALRRAALHCGLECAVSDVGTGGESIAVVIGGTVDRLHELADVIDDADTHTADPRIHTADPRIHTDDQGAHTDDQLTHRGIGLPGLAETIRDRAESGDVVDPATTPGSSTTADPSTTAGESAHPSTSWPWTDGPTVMGILNVTPDSFHDGGRHGTLADAVSGARRMIDAGVGIIDIGGESTRPGADPVPVDDEIDRVVPVVEALQDLPAIADGDVAISIDTRKPDVADAAIAAGADVINDVTGLEDPRMREVVAEAGCPVVVMHSVEAPVDPDTEIEYEDVVEDVLDALQERILRAEAAGIDRRNVIVDPGLGFAKSPSEEFAVLSRIEEFAALGCPVLVGHSHKSMFGALGYDADERGAATVAGTAVAVDRGADIIRVHDVATNRAAVDVVTAVHDPDSVGE